MLKRSAYNVVFDDEKTGDLVCYNSFSGKFVVFGAMTRGEAEDALDNPGAVTGNAHLLLEKHGLLVPVDLDEVIAVEARNHAWKTAGQMMLTVSLTQACNLDCPYCFEPHLARSTMSRDVCTRLLMYVKRSLPSKSGLHIDWYGGEPLARFDLLVEMDKAIGAMCGDAGVRFTSSISTNGTLLTQERAALLAKQTSVQSVRICLDGPPEVHDRYRPFAGGRATFDTIWRNLESAISHLKVKIRVNVDKGNEAHVATLLDLLAASTLNGSNLSVVIKPIVSARLRPRDNAYTPMEWAQVGPRLKQAVLDRKLSLEGGGERTCSHCAVFNNDQFMVDHRGNLYKCSDTFAPEESVGRILEGGQIEVDTKKVDPWTAFPTHYDTNCRSCAALPLCMGGCTFRRLAFSANWCGAERYDLQAHAQLRYNASRARRTSPDIILDRPVVEV